MAGSLPKKTWHTRGWRKHFELAADGITILGQSDVGEATIRLLAFNHPDRLLEREALRAVGRYPTRAALEKMLKQP